MRMSQSFFQSSHFGKDNQALDLVTLAAKAGFVHKDGSGLYSLLHLGQRAQRQMEDRLRQAFEAAGAHELRLSLLQDLGLWQATGRVDAYDGELMTVRSRSGSEYALGATAEELACAIAKELFQGQAGDRWVFQIGTKWRDELRCRAGLVRAREFTMADAYAFSSSDDRLRQLHEQTQDVMLGFFESLDLQARRVVADAGQMGGSFSEEIQVKSSLGDQDGDDRWLEVGHSFLLGDTYSRALGFTDNHGQFVRMGCQGVGLSRTLMAWLERHRDERGFFGTESFSAVDTVVVALNQHKDGVMERALELGQRLRKAGRTVMVDDRDERAGRKLSDSELVGARQRIVVSDRALAADRYEVTCRQSGNTVHTSWGEVVEARAE